MGLRKRSSITMKLVEVNQPSIIYGLFPTATTSYPPTAISSFHLWVNARTPSTTSVFAVVGMNERDPAHT